MMRLWHQPRATRRFSLKEKRLCMMTGNVDVMSDRIVDALQDKDRTAEALSDLNDDLEDMEEQEKQEVMSSVNEKLALLRPEELRQVDANLDRLNVDQLAFAWAREISAFRLAIKKKLEQVKQDFEFNESPEERKGVVANVKGFVSDKWQEAGEWWENMSPETRSNIKGAGVATGVAVGAYAVYKFGKWFFGGVKKAKDTTVEKTKQGMSWLKKGALVAGVGVAGFFGFKAIESYLKNKAMAGIKEQYENAKAIVENAHQYSQKKVQEAKETVEKLEDRIEQLAVVSEPKPTAVPEKSGEQKEKSAIDEEKKRQAEMVARAGSIPLIARGLAAFLTVPDWDVAQHTKVQHMTDVISANKDETMGELFSKVTERSVDMSLIASKNDVLYRKKALLALVTYCRDQREGLQSAGTSEEEINAMTLEQYIRAVGGSYGVTGTIIENLENNGGDIAKALSETDVGSLMQASGGLQGELEVFLDEHNKEDSKLDEMEMMDVILELPAFQISLDEFVAEYEGEEEHEPIEILLYEICKEMETMKTHEYMLPFFHGVFPDDDELNTQETDKEKCRLILHSRLSLHQAVRFHMYARMMRSGNAAGVVLMQSEIFKHVVSTDEGFLQYKKYLLVDRIAKASTGATWEQLEEADVDIDDELVSKALRNMGHISSNIASSMFLAALGGIKEIVVGGTTIAIQNPLTVGTPLALSAGGLGYLRYRRLRMRTTPGKVLLQLESIHTGRQADAKIVRAFRGLEISTETIDDAYTALDKVKNGINQIEDVATRKVLREALQDCTSATFTDSNKAWGKLADLLAEKHITLEWVDSVRKIRDTKQIRASISIAAQPVWGRIKEYGRAFWADESSGIRGRVSPENPSEFTLNVDENTPLKDSGSTKATAAGETLDATVDDGGPVRKATPVPDDVPDGPKLNVVNEAGETIDPATGKVIDAAEDIADAQPESVAKVADAILDQDAITRGLDSVGGKLTLDNMDEFLDWARKNKVLEEDMIGLIGKSRSAKTLLIGAAESGDIVEVNRVLSAAKGTRSLGIMKVFGAAGFAGDILGVYMAYADFVANGSRIESAKKTNNQALLDLYNQANVVYAAEGVGSAAGLTIGTVAIVNATIAGESVMTALASAGGTVVLPIAVAALGGRAVYNQAEKVTETWSRTAEDWVQALTPGEQLEKLKELGPGSYSYWQGWGTGTVAEQAARKVFTSRESYREWAEEGAKDIEGANTGTRIELTEAYVISTAILAQKEGESDAAFQKRFDQYIMDQMYYLGQRSQGTYSYQMSEGYELARDYARLRAKSRELQQVGQSEIIEWENSEGTQYSFDLAEFENLSFDQSNPIHAERVLAKYRRQQESMTVVQLNLMEQLKSNLSVAEKQQVVKQQLLMACQDDLNKLEGRISSADFNGIMSDEELGEAYARYVASKLFSQQLNSQTSRLLQAASSSTGLSPKQYQNAVFELRATLGENDPVKFQEIARKQGYYREGYVVDPASVRNVLSLQHFIKKAADQVKWVEAEKLFKKQLEETSPEDKRAMLHSVGDSYGLKQGMNAKYKRIIGNENPQYLYVKYGNVFNKNLYAKFVDGKWKVALGGGGDGPWHDPSSYRAQVSTFGFSESMAAKYNRLIRGFDDLNSSF